MCSQNTLYCFFKATDTTGIYTYRHTRPRHYALPIWSADFPTGPVDGVFEVDALALRGLLAVIGPVELDGVNYTADNVVSEVLNEAYLRFDDAAERAERQEVDRKSTRLNSSH